MLIPISVSVTAFMRRPPTPVTARSAARVTFFTPCGFPE